MADFQKKKPKPIMVDAVLGIDELELIQSDSFAVLSAVTSIDSTVEEKLQPILAKLKSKAYKFNYANDSRDILSQKVFKKFEIFSDVFLPFKGFNKEGLISSDDEEPILATLDEPSLKAHKIAAKYKYNKPKDEDENIKYNALNEMAKKFTARDVHLLLGSKCATKIKFLIIYTNDTAESTSEVDYKVTGNNVVFPIKLAEALEIPIFNLNKPSRLDDLAEYVNNL